MDKVMPLGVIDLLMSLRAKSWALSRKEDDKLNEIHAIILYRSEVDKQIDRLESRMTEWQKCHETEPKGFFGWLKCE